MRIPRRSMCGRSPGRSSTMAAHPLLLIRTRLGPSASVENPSFLKFSNRSAKVGSCGFSLRKNIVPIIIRGVPYLVALDEGTTSARAALYNETGIRIAMQAGPIECHFPHPGLSEFRERNPDVTVTLTLTDRPAVSAEDNWDLIIHIGELRNSSLVMIRLAPN